MHRVAARLQYQSDVDLLLSAASTMAVLGALSWWSLVPGAVSCWTLCVLAAALLAVVVAAWRDDAGFSFTLRRLDDDFAAPRQQTMPNYVNSIITIILFAQKHRHSIMQK